MKTTFNVDNHLLKKASEITGISDNDDLINTGLEALITLESYKRLAKLGGTEKQIKSITRRRLK